MRRLAVACAALLVAALFGTPAAAKGGGGGGFCSEGSFTDDHTTTVRMAKACFTPTVTRVDVGDTVTWINLDKAPHQLGGVTNVFGDMHTEIPIHERISYTFEQEGVFPYVCLLHPGMAGAVVVGDGEGKLAGTVASEGSTTAGGTTGWGRAEEAAATDDRGAPWLLVGGIVLAATALVVLLIPRRRRVVAGSAGVS